MMDFFGWTCYSPRLMSWITILDVATWAVFIFIAYRAYKLRAENRLLKAQAQALAAKSRRDLEPGKVYTLGENAGSRPPRAPENRSR